MKYYLIHNGDEARKERMLKCFENSKVNNNDVTWMIYPNREHITDELIKEIVAPGLTYSNDQPRYAQQEMSRGLISCTFKHYLSLKDIVENNHEYAVVMEDNMTLGENVPDKLDLYIKQLNEMYPDWDIIFDNAWCDEPVRYIEGEIKEGIYVYPKSNEKTNQCHGGTKLTQFYLIRLKAAKKLYENFLPFNHAPDWYMNDLFRKLDIKSFWAEPSNVFKWEHKSSY
jgi:GR25 family glycosyltransferase involved in LPS biosynthesis